MSSINPDGSIRLGTLAEGVRGLVGRSLASVEFVQDYVQLHFDGPTLTAYTLPTVSSISSATLTSGWRDTLCEQIGSVVSKTEVQRDHLSIAFVNGAVVEVSLKDEDYVGPEALKFSLDANHVWIA
jgi:hypothetical protein